jgi:hypothetical protein
VGDFGNEPLRVLHLPVHVHGVVLLVIPNARISPLFLFELRGPFQLAVVVLLALCTFSFQSFLEDWQEGFTVFLLEGILVLLLEAFQKGCEVPIFDALLVLLDDGSRFRIEDACGKCVCNILLYFIFLLLVLTE